MNEPKNEWIGMAGKAKIQERLVHHRDGSLWAKGQVQGSVMVGYWEWYRKDGTRMRSGYFEEGEQAGEWVTYDRKGKVVKVTRMKRKGEDARAAKKSRK